MRWASVGRGAAVLAVLAGCSAGGDREPTTTVPRTTTSAAGDALPIELSPLLGRPSAVAVRDGTVWVADDGRDVVVRLDASNGAQLGPTVPVPPAPIAMAVGAGGLWVAGAGGTLARIDPATGTVGEVTQVGGTPADVLVVGDTVWVADLGRSAVVPVDASSGTPDAPVPVAAGAVRLAASGERLWVTNLDSTVTSIDLATHEVGEPLVVGGGPIGLAVADGVVWVANGDDGTVSRLDEATGEPLGDPVPVGAAPVGLAVVGHDLWVIEQDGRSATRIDTRTGTVELRSGDLATRPRDVVGDDGAVWVVGVDPSAAVVVADV